MPANIGNINRVLPGLIENVNSPKLIPKADKAEGTSGDFGGLLSNMIQNVANAQAESGKLEDAMLAGEPVELHQVMIKGAQAGVSMDLLLEVRNKLLDAYKELMRMPM